MPTNSHRFAEFKELLKKAITQYDDSELKTDSI